MEIGDARPEARDAGRAARTAGALHLILGVGFGTTSVPTLLYFAEHGELPISPFGFRSLSGPFEALGPDRFLALGWAFVGVCAIDAVAGLLLWQGRRPGLGLGLVTDVLQTTFGLGFALPFLLLGVPVRAALAVSGTRGPR